MASVTKVHKENIVDKYRVLHKILIVFFIFFVFGCSGKTDKEENINNINKDFVSSEEEMFHEDDYGQTVEIRIYHYFESLTNSDFTYITVELPLNNFLENAISYLNTNTGFIVKNIWYEGTRLIVDFDQVMISRFEGMGTSGAFQMTNGILRSFSSFPNVTEMKFLFNGEEDLWGDHFSFEGIFPAGSFIRIVSGAEEPNILGLWERENDNTRIFSFMDDKTYREGQKESSWDRIGKWELYGSVLTITIERGAYQALDVPIIERYNITIVHDDRFFWLENREEIAFIRSDYMF